MHGGSIRAVCPAPDLGCLAGIAAAGNEASPCHTAGGTMFVREASALITSRGVICYGHRPTEVSRWIVDGPDGACAAAPRWPIPYSAEATRRSRRVANRFSTR